jgi:hypothetical protein
VRKTKRLTCFHDAACQRRGGEGAHGAEAGYRISKALDLT